MAYWDRVVAKELRRRVRRAEVEAIEDRVNAKANASTVGGIANALNHLQTTVAGKANTDDIPIPATDIPAPEATGGNAGDDAHRFAMKGHQHPRLTSTTIGSLGTNGLSAAMMFSRTFAAEPGTVLTPIRPGGTQPVSLEINAWIMANGQTYAAGQTIPANAGAYVGCIVKGYRGASTTLAAVTVLGVSVAVGSQTINPNSGSVNGVRFSCVVVQRSDV